MFLLSDCFVTVCIPYWLICENASIHLGGKIQNMDSILWSAPAEHWAWLGKDHLRDDFIKGAIMFEDEWSTFFCSIGNDSLMGSVEEVLDNSAWMRG